MPIYDPYTAQADAEHITAQHHSLGKAHRPLLCHLPKMAPQLASDFPKSYEEGIDDWDGPLWPGQDHANLLKGETEVLPHDYRVTDPHINEPKSYEEGIDDWDGPLWPNQDHAELRPGETEVLPHDYKVSDSHINPTASPSGSSPSSLEEGMDDWDGPLWPGQNHAGLYQGETEVLPTRYRIAEGGRTELKEKDEPKVEIEIVGYEEGIDGWDGPMWPGQDHAGLRGGETEVLPAVYHVQPELKL